MRKLIRPLSLVVLSLGIATSARACALPVFGVLAPSPAVAVRGSVIAAPVVVARPAIIVARPPIVVARPLVARRPLFAPLVVRRPVVVARPLFAPRRAVIARPLIVLP